MSGEQELGITESKEHSPGEWYAEVVQKAGLADYAPMGGFIVTRPRGYAVWERIQSHLDGWFKDTGVQNAYFPLFIPESYLEREKDVVEGFDPEVAWVTHGGHEELEERLAVRPTSESIIAPFMAQWTRSHRDLPMRLNQWCSVVRWEATETKPFFRTKEFLWQEGHTAHADEEGAWDETMTRLDQYERLYEEVMAMPPLKGRKPEHDKFPGAHTTTTVEALMPDGKSVQAATSHYLGTSFAEAFDITYADESEEEKVAHTTSWGLSWRAMGALIMTHSDDQGLVLPPALAPTQVVVVPIWQEDTKDDVLEYSADLAAELEAAGIRVELDDRDHRNPGFKYNEHELNGVPLRIEVGPHEVDDEEATLVHRPDGESETVDREDIDDTVADHLDTVHAKLYASAEETLEGEIRKAESREKILGTIGQHGGYVKCGWCGDEDCEDPIKEAIAAEIVMVPLDRDEEPVHDECAICGEDAEETAYFAKSY
ncbi:MULTISPECIES: proline--tRNA ligase [Haloarcula]|uniref:Proline--tRNA ligase n=1 Tax=Haloarcula pellucida TaxID=1427151 RepID=A0A830GGM5_9EURY|nr:MULTISPECIES: proline--tRNA ligase [Halomicroarcula]MBX0346792.1 proline--tRNA ligase [Halomicroarcula pellucida]MDS0277330.1 proline--tRNA ligase [Halomicroarcula sp. S1AR25-4]GGN85530.1 proline--tRNA ligase [Halomicroarcula pellucida]